MGKMTVFKVLDDKSIVKAENFLFYTLILVPFPYNHFG